MLLKKTAWRILILVQIPARDEDSPLPLQVSYSPPVLLQTCPHVFGTFMHSHAGLNVSSGRVIEPNSSLSHSWQMLASTFCVLVRPLRVLRISIAVVE